MQNLITFLKAEFLANQKRETPLSLYDVLENYQVTHNLYEPNESGFTLWETKHENGTPLTDEETLLQTLTHFALL